MSPSWGILCPTMAMDLSLVGDYYRNGSVLLTWPHVVVLMRGLIVETGISLMELDCHSGLIFESLGDQRVNLFRRSGGNSPVGIYRCYIATVAVLYESV